MIDRYLSIASLGAVAVLATATAAWAQIADATEEGGTLRLEAHWPPVLEQYLPDGQTYDPAFPRPESVLGWPVGSWHVRHDQLVNWFEAVAEASPRMELIRYGSTHEARPLLLAVVSSPANLARIDEIRESHVRSVREGAETHDGPGVVWMGYGVHGNESSATNSSMLLAYHLGAATGPEIEAFLDDTVVLIDPCVNPDGGARFAHWANMHRGQNLVGASSSREHNESWPGGRTNHYWFDLNRDWLLLTHPESRGRVAQFQRWLPTVLTDYHEMGSGSTYFFQPGIPTRRNPLTPESNHALTAKIAKYHAAALDAKGSLYFTEERFDDFYYGKGSTYPDVHGSIGILFEQASSRGHLMDTSQGELSFPFTIENQFTTSLTTLQAFDEMRDELEAHQRGFYRRAAKEGAAYETAGWAYGDANDPGKADEMTTRLRMHGIEVRSANEALRGGTEAQYFVPAAQPQFQLVRALFETRTSWDDNTFYDVSSWTFPLSFGVWHQSIARADGVQTDEDGQEKSATSTPAYQDLPNAAGYIIPWDSLDAPRAAVFLMHKGVAVRAIEHPITLDVNGAERTFGRGSLIVTCGGQSFAADAIRPIIIKMQESVQLAAYPIPSGLLPGAPDLGSGSYAVLDEPNVLLAVGSGVSAYEAGEMWHDLDTRVGLAVTTVVRDRLASMDLSSFTHIVLVSGATSGWGDNEKDEMRSWVRKGGVLVATKRSALWAAANLLSTSKDEHDHEADEDTDEQTGDEATNDAAPARYEDYEGLRAAQRVAGTIFEVDVDNSHPIAFGMRDKVAVFRNFEEVLPEGDDPFATPVRYTNAPLLSGFASAANVKKFAKTPAIRVERVGRGTVIAMVDNPVFRGVWYGTRPFLVNSIFFGGMVSRTARIDVRTEDEEAAFDHGHAHNR